MIFRFISFFRMRLDFGEEVHWTSFEASIRAAFDMNSDRMELQAAGSRNPQDSY